MLGGNPEFLARSDWKTVIIGLELPTQGAARYEDSLRELRESTTRSSTRRKKIAQEGEALISNAAKRSNGPRNCKERFAVCRRFVKRASVTKIYRQPS